MIIGGKKLEKFHRSKPRKNSDKEDEKESFKVVRKKHRDKALDRMRKQDEYDS